MNLLLRVSFLILLRIGHGEASAIDSDNAVPTPEIGLKDASLAIVEEIVMNRVEAIEGQLGASHAIGTGFIRRRRLILRKAKCSGLTDGVAASATRTSGLPKEGPEGKT